jgi:hypothetical protein
VVLGERRARELRGGGIAIDDEDVAHRPQVYTVSKTLDDPPTCRPLNLSKLLVDLDGQPWNSRCV